MVVKLFYIDEYARKHVYDSFISIVCVNTTVWWVKFVLVGLKSATVHCCLWFCLCTAQLRRSQACVTDLKKWLLLLLQTWDIDVTWSNNVLM